MVEVWGFSSVGPRLRAGSWNDRMRDRFAHRLYCVLTGGYADDPAATQLLHTANTQHQAVKAAWHTNRLSHAYCRMPRDGNACLRVCIRRPSDLARLSR